MTYIRMEAADDLISGQAIETFWNYVQVNLWVASFSSIQENQNFGVKEQEYLMDYRTENEALESPVPQL